MPTKSVPTKSRSVRGKTSHGWKITQARNKIKKKVRLALFVIGTVILLLLSAQVINFAKTLLRPWNLQALSKNYLWDRESSINVAVKGIDVSLLNLNPVQKKVTIIPIPDQTLMDVPRSFGSWQLRSIYDLGQSEGIGGGKLIEDTLTSFLGIPVEGFIKLKGNLWQKSAQDLVFLIRQNPVNVLTLLKNIDSDLTLGELLRLNLNLIQIRFDKVKTLDLVKAEVLDLGKLADGTEVFTSDFVRLDSVLSDLADDKLKEEHQSIAVFNATDHPLIAQKAARLITNLGGNVIHISNAPVKFDKTFVFGEKSKTINRLIQIFGSGCSKGGSCDKIEADLSQISSRAQINVVLGEDFFLRY